MSNRPKCVNNRPGRVTIRPRGMTNRPDCVTIRPGRVTIRPARAASGLFVSCL